MASGSKQVRTRERETQPVGWVIIGLVFASGFAGLVYQVLWMKQLGLLFGNTAHAAAATLAAFFAGLGAGSWWWGRRVSAAGRPLRLYAWLEFGIALSALTYFGVLKLFHAIYPALYGSVSGTGWMLAVKFALALVLVFPAAFFMGGTVPAIGQAVIRQPERLGRTGAMLYAVNTLGAALGVAIAAFTLIPSLGFSMTYTLAVALSVAVGVVAWRLPAVEAVPIARKEAEIPDTGSTVERLALAGLCFFSGFVILALEVVWTRVFAQVHENSVYSYAIILIVVLIGLAAGAGISSVVARLVTRPWAALGVMTVAGGGLLVLGPSMLMHVTQGLRPVDSIEPWGDYVRGLFNTGFRGVGFVVVAMGTVFPFLMKLAEKGKAAPGWKLGRLLAINTAGAIAGALLCGFVMLPHWGMWGTLRALAAVYLVVALLLPLGWGRVGIGCRVAGVALLALAFTALDPTGLPVAGSARGKDEGRVLQAWEGSDGTVTVIERTNGHRVIKVNGGYGLGSTEAYLEQADQARIPLHLFPQTESIFFIGLGTGISAGAALDERFPNIRRVLSCELIPAVVEAARTWIPPEMTGGVFDDPRSTILIEDGRHLLRASDERFDMINSDLFLPYRRGAGSLYSLEHFRVAASRLNEGGVFVQWLPLYQLTEYEFGVIARTMLEAFGEVTMWRNNFQPGLEKVALIGRRESSPVQVPPAGEREAMLAAVDGLQWQPTTPDMVRVAAGSIPFLYAGNLTAAADLFRSYPVNTDDRPVIEYQTPKTFRKVAENDKVIWCVGPRLTAWIDRLFEACPPEEDPLWAGHPETTAHLVKAGAAFHRSMVGKALGDLGLVDAEWEVFLREWRLGAR
ncbi:MAG TPA: fused MFS/spermidine synthase [Luteolibacter sp.]|nr:fused MFS/spermidine synthase [Luteolibacter sp.]